MAPLFHLIRLLLSATASFAASTVAVAASGSHKDRPNILWLVSEDNNPYLSCYDEPLARTPRLDTLAREGLRYTRVHAPAPVCAPTRSSLITGRYAPSLGTHPMRCVVPMPETLRYYPAFLRDAGYFCTNNAKTDYNAEVLPGTWDQNGEDAHWRNRTAGQPFFSVINFFVTHESSLHQRQTLTTDPSRVRVPRYLPDTEEVRADRAQYLDRMALLDRQIGDALNELEASGLADNTIVFYYADNGGALPRSKRTLYHDGTHVPLIIRFPERWRHLAPADPGTTIEELVSLVDLPPTLVSLAGLPVPRQFQGRALAGPARTPGPTYVYAFRDRMDERYDVGRVVIGPRFRYIRNYRPDLPAGQHVAYLWRMSSMAQWHARHLAGELDPQQDAFFQPRPAEELYDVETDPDNLRNLAGDPAHGAILRDMRAANRRHLLATRDLGFIPEPMLRRLAAGRSPAVLGDDTQVYPLAEVLETLDRLQLAEGLESPDFAAGFSDARAVIRYWSAVTALRDPARADGIEALLDDDEPCVRFAAAAVMLRREPDPRAWGTLATALGPDSSPETRLLALNFLSLQPGPLPAEVTAALRTIPPATDEMFTLYNRVIAEELLAR